MAPALLDAHARRELIAALASDDPFCAEPPEDAATSWTEARIRAFFEAGGVDASQPAFNQPARPTLTHEQVLAKYPPPAAEEFARWFPGLERSKTRCESPRLRLVCFTNAGNEENIFTNEGLGARRVAVLLEWCRANNVELLAPQLPGRGARAKEPFLPDVQTAAAHVLRLLASRLTEVPYCVIGHSVGTWVAFEMLALAREQGVPLPRKARLLAVIGANHSGTRALFDVASCDAFCLHLKAFLSCFPAPDIPVSERPWTPQRGLADDAFKMECRGWDVSEALFSDASLWAQYVSLMRADFSLFDEYAFRRAGEPPFAFPIVTFHATADRKISSALVARWAKMTTGGFTAHGVQGHHLFVMGVGEQRATKEAWLTTVVTELRGVLP